MLPAEPTRLLVATEKLVAAHKIAAALPREDEWRSAADFMEYAASVLDAAGIKRPDHYPADR